MTVLVAVRTASTVVFAADSKLTTSSLVGFDTNGDPQFLPQTYDNAVKLGHDLDRSFIVALTGNATFGDYGVIDFLSQARSVGSITNEAGQDAYLHWLIADLAHIRFEYWESRQVPRDRWPVTALLLATTSPETKRPRLWRICFDEDRCEADPIENGIFLDGSYMNAFRLLYGYSPQLIEHIVNETHVTETTMRAAIDSFIPKPINQINVLSMPIQDAMDLAHFLARVQIEMERFLPGAPLCGGPVDLMVLQGAPFRDIKEFPGKSLQHPT